MNPCFILFSLIAALDVKFPGFVNLCSFLRLPAVTWFVLPAALLAFATLILTKLLLLSLLLLLLLEFWLLAVFTTAFTTATAKLTRHKTF